MATTRNETQSSSPQGMPRVDVAVEGVAQPTAIVTASFPVRWRKHGDATHYDILGGYMKRSRTFCSMTIGAG
jgi:hypothetical protein